MAANIQKTVKDLKALQDAMVAILDRIDLIEKDIRQFDGEIARVLPAYLESLTTELENLVDGEVPYSASKLVEFVVELPIGETLSKPRGKTSSTDTGPIDTTPDIAAGPQSAIAGAQASEPLQEGLQSETLKRYMREALNPQRPELGGDWDFEAVQKSIQKDAGEFDELAGYGEDNPVYQSLLPGKFNESTRYKPRGSSIMDEIRSNPAFGASRPDADMDHLIEGASTPEGSLLRETDRELPVADHLQEGSKDLSSWKDIVRSTGGPTNDDLASMIVGR